MADIQKTIKELQEWINRPAALGTSIDPWLVHDCLDLLNDQQHQICELQEVNEHLRDSRHLDERHLKLLIFALRIGWQVIDHSRNYFEYCDDARNDYFLMTEKLSEIIGENLDETRD